MVAHVSDTYEALVSVDSEQAEVGIQPSARHITRWELGNELSTAVLVVVLCILFGLKKAH